MASTSLESSPKLYEILCIAEFSGAEEIKKAYKQLALRYHPDKNLNDPSCVDKFREVRIAYEVLSNTDKKKRYDISLKVHKATTGQYGRAAMGGSRASARTTAGTSNPYMQGNMNANIYEELSRQQQQRRTASKPATANGGASGASGASGRSARTASARAHSGATANTPSGGNNSHTSQYTKEQQEAFRRRERERQNELRRQLDRERVETREREREQKRREQERQEELLQERWRQQQATYAAATVQPRSARRAAAPSSATSLRPEWRTVTPPRSTTTTGGGGNSPGPGTNSPYPSFSGGSNHNNNPNSNYYSTGSSTASPLTAAENNNYNNTVRVPDLNLGPNLARTNSGSSNVNGDGNGKGGLPTPRHSRRTSSAVRRGGGGSTSASRASHSRSSSTPKRRGASSSSRGHGTGGEGHSAFFASHGLPHTASGENLSFANFDGTPFRKAHTPRGPRTSHTSLMNNTTNASGATGSWTTSPSTTPPPQSEGDDDVVTAQPSRPTPTATTTSASGDLATGAPRHSPAFPVNRPVTSLNQPPPPVSRRRTMTPTAAAGGSPSSTTATPRSREPLGTTKGPTTTTGGEGNGSTATTPRHVRPSIHHDGEDLAGGKPYSPPPSTRSKLYTPPPSTRSKPYTPPPSTRSTAFSTGTTGSSGSTAKGARTAAALHSSRNTTAGQKERQRQRELRAEEQEKEIQRLLRLRRQREAAAAAAAAAEEAETAAEDPQARLRRLCELCVLDEKSERKQLIEQEEGLARHRVTRWFNIGLENLVFGPATRHLQVKELAAREAVLAAERLGFALLLSVRRELQARLELQAFEAHQRRQLRGREATVVYYVLRSGRLKRALVGEETMRRRRLQQEEADASAYKLTVMGPEFFGRMTLFEVERAERRALVRFAREEALLTALPSPSMSAVLSEVGGAFASPLRTARAPLVAGTDGAFLCTVLPVADTVSVGGGEREAEGDGGRVPKRDSAGKDNSSIISSRHARHAHRPNHGSEGEQRGADMSALALSPLVSRGLSNDEDRRRATLRQKEVNEMAVLLRDRGAALHDCYRRQERQAVLEAQRAASERIAQLEAELAAARGQPPPSTAEQTGKPATKPAAAKKADGDGTGAVVKSRTNAAARSQNGGKSKKSTTTNHTNISSGISGVQPSHYRTPSLSADREQHALSLPMRVCTPSSLEGSGGDGDSTQGRRSVLDDLAIIASRQLPKRSTNTAATTSAASAAKEKENHPASKHNISNGVSGGGISHKRPSRQSSVEKSVASCSEQRQQQSRPGIHADLTAAQPATTSIAATAGKPKPTAAASHSSSIHSPHLSVTAVAAGGEVSPSVAHVTRRSPPMCGLKKNPVAPAGSTDTRTNGSSTNTSSCHAASEEKPVAKEGKSLEKGTTAAAAAAAEAAVGATPTESGEGEANIARSSNVNLARYFPRWRESATAAVAGSQQQQQAQAKK